MSAGDWHYSLANLEMAANSSSDNDAEMEDSQPSKSPLSANDVQIDEIGNELAEVSVGIETEDAVDESEQDPLMELKRCKEWLQQQKLDHDSELNSRRLQLTQNLQPPSPPSSQDSSVSALHERPEATELGLPVMSVGPFRRISELQDKLYSTSTAKSYKKFVLDRLLCGDMLIKKLFPDTMSDTPSEQQLEEMNAFADAHRKQDALCAEVVDKNQTLIDSSEQLYRLKKESFELKKSNRELIARLQRLKQEKDTSRHEKEDNRARLKSSTTQLDATIQKISIVTNIFQALIAGSAIDWASNDEIRELVVSLGQPLDTSLRATQS